MIEPSVVQIRITAKTGMNCGWDVTELIKNNTHCLKHRSPPGEGNGAGKIPSVERIPALREESVKGGLSCSSDFPSCLGTSVCRKTLNGFYYLLSFLVCFSDCLATARSQVAKRRLTCTLCFLLECSMEAWV